MTAATGLASLDVARALDSRLDVVSIDAGTLRVIQRRPRNVAGVAEVLIVEEQSQPDIPFHDGGIGAAIGRPRLRVFVRWPRNDADGGAIVAEMVAQSLRHTPPDGYYLSRVVGPFALGLVGQSSEDHDHLEWSMYVELEWHKRPRPIFYGVAADPPTLTEAWLRALPSTATVPGRAWMFTATAGVLERLYFACPQDFGVPVFALTAGAFTLVDDAISVTHELATESYALYQTATSIGATTAKVR